MRRIRPPRNSLICMGTPNSSGRRVGVLMIRCDATAATAGTADGATSPGVPQTTMTEPICVSASSLAFELGAIPMPANAERPRKACQDRPGIVPLDPAT